MLLTANVKICVKWHCSETNNFLFATSPKDSLYWLSEQEKYYVWASLNFCFRIYCELEMKKLISILYSENVEEHLEPQGSHSVFCSLKQ